MVNLNIISLFDECNMLTSGLDVIASYQMLVSSLLMYCKKNASSCRKESWGSKTCISTKWATPSSLYSLFFRMDYIKNLTQVTREFGDDFFINALDVIPSHRCP